MRNRWQRRASRCSPAAGPSPCRRASPRSARWRWGEPERRGGRRRMDKAGAERRHVVVHQLDFSHAGRKPDRRPLPPAPAPARRDHPQTQQHRAAGGASGRQTSGQANVGTSFAGGAAPEPLGGYGSGGGGAGGYSAAGGKRRRYRQLWRRRMAPEVRAAAAEVGRLPLRRRWRCGRPAADRTARAAITAAAEAEGRGSAGASGGAGGNGGAYGGGGGGGDITTAGGNGGGGALRIIWGAGRSYHQPTRRTFEAMNATTAHDVTARGLKATARNNNTSHSEPTMNLPQELINILAGLAFSVVCEFHARPCADTAAEQDHMIYGKRKNSPMILPYFDRSATRWSLKAGNPHPIHPPQKGHPKWPTPHRRIHRPGPRRRSLPSRLMQLAPDAARGRADRGHRRHQCRQQRSTPPRGSCALTPKADWPYQHRRHAHGHHQPDAADQRAGLLLRRDARP